MATRKQVFNNFIWRFLERTGAQGVTFIVSIILARILDPEVYGTIALVTVFTTLMQAFVDGGLGNALIQKKDADDLDFSSVFYFNIFICVILYFVMFIIAPLISSFYDDPLLTPVIRVLSLVIIISGVKNVQQAYVSRHFLFKKFFFSTIGGTIGAAIIGIVMAYCGFGVWALVAQMVFNVLVDTMILWITVKWRPIRAFSWCRLKELIRFGWKILTVSVIDAVYNDIRQLIIGKIYTKDDLAYFNRGKQFPSVIVNNINNSIDSVLLPAMSAKQDDLNAIKSITRRAITVSSYVLWPVIFGLAACAKPIVILLLTDKWVETVPYLQMFCITFGLYPIFTANYNAYKAVGRSDIYLKVDFAQKILGVIILLIVMSWGVIAIAYSMVITSVLCLFITTYPNRKMIDYGFLSQMKDVYPQLFLSLIMGLIVYCVQFLGLGCVVTLIIQVPVGVVVYYAGSKIFHIDSFEYLISTVKGLFGRKKKKEVEE